MMGGVESSYKLISEGKNIHTNHAGKPDHIDMNEVTTKYRKVAISGANSLQKRQLQHFNAKLIP